MNARRIASAAAFALLALTLAGCAWLPSAPDKQSVPVFFADRQDVARVRRVMVLPFQNAPGVHDDSNEELRAVFIGELAKLQRFELVPLPAGANEDEDLYHSLGRGRISTVALAKLGERYNIDGVLLGTVTGYRPYTPPHLGLRLQLISLHTAAAVWATEVFYDAGNAATVEDIKHFTYTFLAEEASLHGWEIAMISPTRFVTFVCHRLVGTWRDPRYGD